GSMIRDVVTGRVPGVFGDNQPTVIPAIAASVIVLLSDAMGYLAVGMVVGPVVSIFLSLLGYWGGWRLNSNPEWAPVNESAAQVAELAKKAEDTSRAVGRKYEPSRIRDRKSTRLNSSHVSISYAVFCLKKKNTHASFSCIITILYKSSQHKRYKESLFYYTLALDNHVVNKRL